MAVFLVVPLQNRELTEELERRIHLAIPDANDVMIPAERNYALVSYNGLSNELRDALNLTGLRPLANTSAQEVNKNENSVPPVANEQILAMVVNLLPGSFNGFGPGEIWEWINTHFINTQR